mmetsp:Transcript_101296/g.291803  ORF Transcript_101296/g.291803 Transcript_101296/m.291803 type:complete len:348 (+) Transcript_101296:77-1120(+)
MADEQLSVGRRAAQQLSGIDAPHPVLSAVQHLRGLVRFLSQFRVPECVVVQASHHLLQALLGLVEAPLREQRLLNDERRLLESPQEGLGLEHHGFGVRMNLLLEGLVAVRLQQIVEQLFGLRPRDGPRALEAAVAQRGGPVRRRHFQLLRRLQGRRVAVLFPLLELVLCLGRQVLLPIFHLLELSLLGASQSRRRRRAIGQEAPAREHATVAQSFEELGVILCGASFDVLDLFPAFPHIVHNGFPELLVHVFGDLLDLVQDFQRFICATEALQRLRFSEQRLLVVLLEFESRFRRPQSVLPLVHLQRGVGLVVEASSVHRLELFVFFLQVRLGPVIFEQLIALAISC